jgi:hypothetical protein
MEVFMEAIQILPPDEVTVDSRQARRQGRLARLWGRLLTSEQAFDPRLMSSLRVARADTPEAFRQAIALRELKYRGHAAVQEEPEDLAQWSDLYVCYGADRQPLGSVRFSVDLTGTQCLKAQQVTAVPDLWRLKPNGQLARLGEAMRLCVAGRNRKEQLCVKLALWRQVYLRAVELEVDWLLCVARPPLNNDYQLVSYERHQPEPYWIYPPDNPVAHEVMALNVLSEQVSCRQPGHWINRAFFGEIGSDLGTPCA